MPKLRYNSSNLNYKFKLNCIVDTKIKYGYVFSYIEKARCRNEPVCFPFKVASMLHINMHTLKTEHFATSLRAFKQIVTLQNTEKTRMRELATKIVSLKITKKQINKNKINI